MVAHSEYDFVNICNQAGLQDYTVQYSAIQCNTVQYSAIQCNTVQYSAIQCNTVQYSAIQCNTVQYSAIQCNTVQYSKTQKYLIIVRGNSSQVLVYDDVKHIHMQISKQSIKFN